MKAIALLVPALLALSVIPAPAQQPNPGFNPADATQHFLLNKDGGIIAIEATNEDPTLPDAIRTHLVRIAAAGVPALQRLGTEIVYTFEATPEGGHVFLKTRNPEALSAIHEYLRAEIREFQTGDTGEIN